MLAATAAWPPHTVSGCYGDVVTYHAGAAAATACEVEPALGLMPPKTAALCTTADLAGAAAAMECNALTADVAATEPSTSFTCLELSIKSGEQGLRV